MSRRVEGGGWVGKDGKHERKIKEGTIKVVAQDSCKQQKVWNDAGTGLLFGAHTSTDCGDK